VIGRRVVFIYDEEFVLKIWVARKRKQELAEKIRKLKEGKFKNYSKKILGNEINMDKFNELIEECTENSEELNEGR